MITFCGGSLLSLYLNSAFTTKTNRKTTQFKTDCMLFIQYVFFSRNTKIQADNRDELTFSSGQRKTFSRIIKYNNYYFKCLCINLRSVSMITSKVDSLKRKHEDCESSTNKVAKGDSYTENLVDLAPAVSLGMPSVTQVSWQHFHLHVYATFSKWTRKVVALWLVNDQLWQTVPNFKSFVAFNPLNFLSKLIWI